MPTFIVTYTGTTSVNIDAATEQEAAEKFWNEGLNDLENAEIDSVKRL